MQEDEEGFTYPHVETESCINCGLCEKACPYLNAITNSLKSRYFAALNPSDSIRLESSSGGVFSLFAEKIIDMGGVVFGVEWNQEWSTIHSKTKIIEELHNFRGSKYVQTKSYDSFIATEKSLKNGDYVLYSGLPCQIMGLNLFLGKKYSNLLTIECVCHGVPSEKLWKQYLFEQCSNINKKIADIISINFRDKRKSWKNYYCTIKFNDGNEISQPHDDNAWMRAFIHNITIRPSCHTCPAKIQNSLADISLGDLWGAQHLLPHEDIQDKGLSLVIVHNEEGVHFCEMAGISLIKEFDVSEVAKYNPAITTSALANPKREKFFSKIQNGSPFIPTAMKMTSVSPLFRLKLKTAKILKRTFISLS